jgi:hypothetical protein
MLRCPFILFRFAAAILKSRRNLVLENLALRHQLLVLGRNARRPRLNPLDRALWAWLRHTPGSELDRAVAGNGFGRRAPESPCIHSHK